LFHVSFFWKNEDKEKQGEEQMGEETMLILSGAIPSNNNWDLITMRSLSIIPGGVINNPGACNCYLPVMKHVFFSNYNQTNLIGRSFYKT
jgi:hypothetical protein